MMTYYDENGRTINQRDKMNNEVIDLEDANINVSIQGRIFEVKNNKKRTIGMYMVTYIGMIISNTWHDLYDHSLHVDEKEFCVRYKVCKVDFVTNEFLTNIIDIPFDQIDEKLESNSPSKVEKIESPAKADPFLMGYKIKTIIDDGIIIAPYIPVLNMTSSLTPVMEKLAKAYDAAKKEII